MEVKSRLGTDIEQYEVFDIYEDNAHKGIYYCLYVSNEQSINLLNLRTKMTEIFVKSKIIGRYPVNLCDIELDDITLVNAFFFGKTNFTNAKLKNINFSDNDRFMQINSSTEYRPDIVSYVSYGMSELWWYIMEANGIKDIYDFKSGITLRIPRNI